MSCKYMHIVSSIDVNASGGNVTLNFSKPVSGLSDKSKFCFKIPCGVYIPDGIDNYLVLVSYNGSTIELWNKYGEVANVGQLDKSKVYKGYFGTYGENSHVISQLPVTYNCGCSNVL